jgi:hypothetical protein
MLAAISSGSNPVGPKNPSPFKALSAPVKASFPTPTALAKVGPNLSVISWLATSCCILSEVFGKGLSDAATVCWN